MMECQNCKEREAVPNEFNYILCQKCLDYFLGIEIAGLVEMSDTEQDIYWSLYEDQHKQL